MKYIFLFLVISGLLSCNQETGNLQVLQTRIDSLEVKINNAHKPGFGDLMGSIQVHHNKLWFAGQNQNWKLADFEIHEISEMIDDIKNYQKTRKETKSIDVLQPSLHNINIAIQQKDPNLFKEGYILLTNACNTCHRKTDYGFIEIKIPDNPPFSNQEFKVLNEK